MTYRCDRERAEAILLDAARKRTSSISAEGKTALESMMRRFPMADTEIEPRVFYRITDNWLELGLRFLAPSHGARAQKDLMSRDILKAFDEAGIGIASSTYDIVGFPTVRLDTDTSKSSNA